MKPCSSRYHPWKLRCVPFPSATTEAATASARTMTCCPRRRDSASRRSARCRRCANGGQASSAHALGKPPQSESRAALVRASDARARPASRVASSALMRGLAEGSTGDDGNNRDKRSAPTANSAEATCPAAEDTSARAQAVVATAASAVPTTPLDASRSKRTSRVGAAAHEAVSAPGDAAPLIHHVSSEARARSGAPLNGTNAAREAARLERAIACSCDSNTAAAEAKGEAGTTAPRDDRCPAAMSTR